MEYAVGIDIGGTNTKIGIVSEAGELIIADSIPTESDSEFSEFAHRVYEKTTALIKESKKEIIGIGVGAPNANSKSGCIEHPPNLNWEVENLVRPFTKKFNKPVKLENDANLSASGERLWGHGKEIDDFIVVTLGTGVGTGTYSSGHLINSFNGMATEGGHLSIKKNGRPCGCGGYGHLESYASVRGIKETVRELTGKDLKFAQILELYEAKDHSTMKAVEITADYLGYGLAQMFTLFIPKKFILAGGVSNLGADFSKLVNESFQKYAYKPFKKECEVVLSEISLKNGAILGAASLLFHGKPTN